MWTFILVSSVNFAFGALFMYFQMRGLVVRREKEITALQKMLLVHIAMEKKRNEAAIADRQAVPPRPRPVV